MTRGKRSRSWHRQHSGDYYVQQARDQGWRSRAAYKLQDIDARDRLFRSGMVVVDLGASPGGWSQYAARRIGPRGRIIAVDLLPLASLVGVEFLQGDFREEATVSELLALLADARADLVMSDMAPNITGVMAIDQPQAMELAELSLQLARRVLRPGGDFLAKLFQGEGFDAFVANARAVFGKVAARKPAASRPHSREVYLVGKNYRL